MSQQILDYSNIAAICDHDCCRTVPGKDMNSTLLFDTCSLLIGHKHAVYVSAIPSSAIIGIEQRLMPVYL